MRNKKLVLKIAASTWENASRDGRELSVVQELGAEVFVMAKGEKTGVREKVKDFPVYRMSTRPLGKHVPKGLNRMVSIFTWAYQARKFQPDVISGHDLIPLFIGWLSSCFQKKENQPKLVYDSHEFTIYNAKKSRFQIFLVTQFERFLIKRCSFAIEVNDKIADEVQRIHKLKDRPVVVRNIPEKWIIDPLVCQETRRQIMKSFVGDNFFLIMYHGGLMPERGIETLIEVLTFSPNLYLFLLGNGTADYVTSLMAFAKEKKVGERVVFHKAVPYTELWKYVGAADVGMVMVKAAWKSYYYMLPNKFFENIQSETPVICSNFPVIEALVKQYKVGMTCDPEKPDEIYRCIQRMQSDREFYRSCKKHTQIAKKVLCWEKEKIALEEAYRRIL